MEMEANEGTGTVDHRAQEGNANQETPVVQRASNGGQKMEFSELQYASDSFYTIVSPVFLTMLLAAISVVFISTPEFAQLTEDSLSQSYTVFKSSDDDSASTKLGLSVVNGLIIVSVICIMTFGIVLLYKYRCMKCLVGYMIVSSTMILGFLASNILRIAVERYEIGLDYVSFFFALYNFAIVGVVCIIAPTGIASTSATQWYLMLTSIIVAWHFARFDAWTAWVLLVLLALYDLFAVLTPCGPLKFLINLMQREDSPMIPGLLYEASLPAATTRNQASSPSEPPQQSTPTESAPPPPDVLIAQGRHEAAPLLPQPSSPQGGIEKLDVGEELKDIENTDSTALSVTDGVPDEQHPGVQDQIVSSPEIEYVRGRVPLVLAKRFKLRFWDDPQPYWTTGGEPTDYTPEQLASEVEVAFYPNGGRVVPTASLENESGAFYRQTREQDEEVRYTVIDYRGEHRRVLFVTNDGRVFQDLREVNDRNDKNERTTIKLGLGDFIFYSILVSKAALYSYTTFVVCTLAIISGLGLTMLLLAIYGKALPALPISIFLGVSFYLITRFCLEPFVEFVFTEQCYF